MSPGVAQPIQVVRQDLAAQHRTALAELFLVCSKWKDGFFPFTSYIGFRAACFEGPRALGSMAYGLDRKGESSKGSAVLLHLGFEKQQLECPLVSNSARPCRLLMRAVLEAGLYALRMLPLILTVLNREYNWGYENPYEGLLV